MIVASIHHVVHDSMWSALSLHYVGNNLTQFPSTIINKENIRNVTKQYFRMLKTKQKWFDYQNLIVNDFDKPYIAIVFAS